MDWRERFEVEIRRGEQARARGNEGQARVCARRAAGIAAAEALARRGAAPTTSSAIDGLQQLMTVPSLPPELLELLDHLVQQVDTDFRLPPGVDLLADARRLRQHLLPD